ncbi:MAG: hypothetical protein ACTSO7_07595 [Candidatus Heimdallarchaeota archaeon]
MIRFRKRRVLGVIFLLLILLTSLSLAISKSTKPNISYKIFKNSDKSLYVWSTAQVVSSTSDLRSLRPSISVDSNDNVHVVWMDQTDLGSIGIDDDIFHKVWNTTTQSWSQVTVISSTSSLSSVDPIIKADDNGNVHIIWRDSSSLLSSGTDSDIFYRLWNQSINSWETIELASPLSTLDVHWNYLDVKNGTAYVVWQDTTNYLGNGADTDVLFSQRFTNGTWTQATTVSVEGGGNSIYPFVFVDNDSNVHVSWEDDTNYLGSGIDHDIFYRFLNVTTDTWSTTEVISSSSTLFSDRSKMVIDSKGNKYIIWVDGTNLQSSGLDTDIFYRYWNATTKAWSNVLLLSDSSDGNSNVASILIDSFDNIYTVWFDATDIASSGFDQDVFFRYWNSTAKSWSDYTVVSIHSTDDSWRPIIDIDSENQLHLVWQDRTINYGGSGGDIDILYSKGLIPEPSPYLIFVNQPEEIVHLDEDTKTYYLTWTASDANVSSPSYTLFVNDVINNFGSWKTDEPINFEIANLAVGNYTYRIDIDDGLDEMITDEVLVVVTTAIKIWVDPVMKFLWGLVVATAPVVVTSIIILLITKRRLQ